MEIPLPLHAFSIPERDDKGKAVIINSVGGCFIKEPGVVLHGPYSYPYALKAKREKYKPVIWHHWPYENLTEKNKADSYNYKHGNAVWQWYVMVPKLGRAFNFVEKELTFK